MPSDLTSRLARAAAVLGSFVTVAGGALAVFEVETGAGIAALLAACGLLVSALLLSWRPNPSVWVRPLPATLAYLFGMSDGAHASAEAARHAADDGGDPGRVAGSTVVVRARLEAVAARIALAQDATAEERAALMQEVGALLREEAQSDTSQASGGHAGRRRRTTHPAAP